MELENILNKNLTVKDMKKIVKFIIEEEAKNENIEIEVLPVTFFEWMKNVEFTGSFKSNNFSDKFFYFLTPLTSFGVSYPNYKKIYIFLNYFNLGKLFNKNITLKNLVHTCYHEFSHIYQKLFLERYLPYQIFSLSLIEYSIREYDYEFYKKNWEKMFSELDAEYYAIKKVKTFFKKYPIIYNKIKNNINDKLKLYEFNYINYDFQYLFEKFLQIYKNNYENFNFDHIFFDVFLEKNSFEFKSLKNIINDYPEYFKLFYPELFFHIITSTTFLEQLNFTELDKTERDIIYNALNFSLNLENKKQIINNQLFENEMDLDMLVSITSKIKSRQIRIDYLNKKLDTFFNNEFVNSNNKVKVLK